MTAAPAMPASGPQAVDRAVLLRRAGAAFDAAGLAWAILGGVDRRTGAVATDAEIAVDAPSLREVGDALRAANDLALVHAVDSRPDAGAWWVTDPEVLAGGTARADETDLLQIDTSLSVAWRGRGVRAREIAAARAPRRDGLVFASAGHRLLYGLAKAAERRAAAPPQTEALAGLLAEDPEGCRAALDGSGAAWICRGALALIDRTMQPDLYRAVAAADRGGTPPRLYPPSAELRRRARRALRPAGLCIALLAPDGTGKSTVAAAVGASTASLFSAAETLHLRPFFGRPEALAAPPAPAPHAEPPRSRPATLAKLFYWWADYTAGFALSVTPRLVRNRLVVFDRYYDDLLVDPRRYRVARTGALARLVGRAIVRPDLTVVLDAPPDVIRARKAELPPEEIERQRDAYRGLAASVPGTLVVDANRPPGTVAAGIVGRIRQVLHRRMAGRGAE